MKYWILQADNSDALAEQVIVKIGEGWQPIGGPTSHEGALYQAVIKTEPDRTKVVASTPAIDLPLEESARRALRIYFDNMTERGAFDEGRITVFDVMLGLRSGAFDEWFSGKIRDQIAITIHQSMTKEEPA